MSIHRHIHHLYRKEVVVLTALAILLAISLMFNLYFLNSAPGTIPTTDTKAASVGGCTLDSQGNCLKELAPDSVSLNPPGFFSLWNFNPFQSVFTEKNAEDMQRVCPLKSRGDANCDSVINEADYDIWLRESTGILTTKTADFNGDGKVTIMDFALWNQNR